MEAAADFETATRLEPPPASAAGTSSASAPGSSRAERDACLREVMEAEGLKETTRRVPIAVQEVAMASSSALAADGGRGGVGSVVSVTDHRGGAEPSGGSGLREVGNPSGTSVAGSAAAVTAKNTSASVINAVAAAAAATVAAHSQVGMRVELPRHSFTRSFAGPTKVFI